MNNYSRNQLFNSSPIVFYYIFINSNQQNEVGRGNNKVRQKEEGKKKTRAAADGFGSRSVA